MVPWSSISPADSAVVAASTPSPVARRHPTTAEGHRGLGGRHQQQLPGRIGEGVSWRTNLCSRRLRTGALLCCRSALPNGSVAVRPQGQFEQRQRIAAALGQGAVTHPGIELSGHRRLQQRGRIVDVETAHDEVRKPRQLRLLVGLAGAEHHAERLGAEPRATKPQRPGRRLVQPLGVVHHADQRLVLIPSHSSVNVAEPTRSDRRRRPTRARARCRAPDMPRGQAVDPIE